ncbi:MAG: YncE family protein [Leptospiraceae bacterium]|nr:YncE family protein [Leptospiraceae bacterium]
MNNVILHPGRTTAALLLFTGLAAQCTVLRPTQNAADLKPAAVWQGLELIKKIPTEQQPKQICFNSSSTEMYVTNMNDGSGRGGPVLTPGSLAVYQLPSGQLMHRQPARTAIECLVTGKGTLLYTDMFRDEVNVFDLKQRQILKRIPIKEDTVANFKNARFRFMPKIIAPAPDGSVWAVSMWLDGVSILDQDSLQFKRRIPEFCKHPRGLLYNNRQELIVMCYGVPDGLGQIVVLDAKADYKIIKKIVTGGSPRHIVAVNSGLALISNLGLGQIYLYDTSTHRILKRLTVGGGPNTIALDVDGDHLYISQRQSNKVSVLSLAEWKIVATIPVGAYPTGLAVSPDGRFMAVSNFHQADLYLYQIVRQGPAR